MNIQQKTSKNIIISQKKLEYNIELKENIFGPSKNSPPNDFILKLKNRMINYSSLGINSSKQNKQKSILIDSSE